LNSVTTSKLVINADVNTMIPENNHIRQGWLEQINDWLDKHFNEAISNTINTDKYSKYKLQINGTCGCSPCNILGMDTILYDEYNKVIDSSSRKYEMVDGTTNIAECLSLIDGLRLAQKYSIKNILVEGGSQLINQITSTYKTSSSKLMVYHDVVTSLIESFDQIDFQPILHRELNRGVCQIPINEIDMSYSEVEVNANNRKETDTLPITMVNHDNIKDNSYTGFE